MANISLLTDIELTDLLKKDDETAFAEIYARYAESLAGFTASKLYSLDDARDVVHDIFTKLWEDRQRLKIDRNLRAYLFTIARYRIIDKIRKNITREEYASIYQAFTFPFAHLADQKLLTKELQLTIDNTLNSLSPRVAEIFRLSREDQLSIAQIAEKLQLSEQTVKNQLSTAIKHLRQSLTLISVSGIVIYLFV